MGKQSDPQRGKMSDFFAMGGYGLYVWCSYLLFFVALVAVSIGPLIRHRQLKHRLEAELEHNNKNQLHDIDS